MRRRFKAALRGTFQNVEDDHRTVNDTSFDTIATPSQPGSDAPAMPPLLTETATSRRIPLLEPEYRLASTSSDTLPESSTSAPPTLPPVALPSKRLVRLGLLSRTSATSSKPVQGTSFGSDIGLHLIHNVEHPSADLILVHGLGGSWLKTWSWKHDPHTFWPSWLSKEEGLARVRIFSFGYNSNFKGVKTNLCILDFAKELLFKMSGYGAGEHKIGRRPIFFVAHSMGGLVVKKAYVLGTLDDSYSGMISRISGVIFLATPHRGSNYARTLNNVLAASMITNAKVYVAELESDSPTLRDINEQFRLVCKDLRLVSFYESIKTRIGASRVMVVGRDSGVLGYPSERSSSMDADHHTVCKFSSPDSPNYTALRDVIQDYVRQCSRSAPEVNTRENDTTGVHEVRQTLTALLGIQQVFNQAAHPGMDGTCSWIQTRDYYHAWVQPSTDMMRILWLTSLPGMGKSTLAQFVVNSFKGDEDMEDMQPGCQYHFFTSSDVAKRKVTYALRSIAFQLALEHHDFRQRLVWLYEKTGLKFEQLEAQVIWTRIYEDIILKMAFDKPLYWVLDGVDESDNALFLLNCLFKAKPKSPIKIFLTSRPAPSLLNLAQSCRDFLTHVPLTIRDTEDDVKLFIWTTLHNAIPISNEMREKIAARMLKMASGSFIWVKLALKTLERAWHTEDDIDQALAGVPQGMQALFSRMVAGIEDTKADNPRNHALARRILTWATCSAEPLTSEQLAAALEPEFTKLQNLEATILDLCGLLLTVTENKVLLIHETARSFLLSCSVSTPFLSGPACHEHLAMVCLTYLSRDRWRDVLAGLQEDGAARTNIISRNRLTLLLSEQPFLPYAVSYWAYHVSNADVEGVSEHLLQLLHGFFNRHILSWIHACVVICGLRVVTRSAQYMKTYCRNRKSRSLLGSTASLSWDDTNFFRLWATDLMRVVGRFGRNLAEKPSSIYNIVPPLCPKGSMMNKSYATQGGLSLHGISSEDWDDCLARLPIGDERTISRVLSTVSYFICLIAVGGEIIVCSTATFEETRRMVHGEYVPHMTLSKSGSMIATAGAETIRVWEVTSGEQLYRIDLLRDALVMTIIFTSNEDEIFVGYDNCMVTSHDLHTGAVCFQFLAEEEDGDCSPCPRAMVFSPDVTQLAMAFSGRPVLIWSLLTHEEQQPMQCIRNSDRERQEGDAYVQLDSVIWHPDGFSVFVLYQDATIVRFDLTNDKITEENKTLAREMVINQDGSLLLTSDNAGTLSLWNLPRFQLLYRVLHEGLVRDLVFSPDSQRIYDVRGTACNIWEPDVLLRAGDDDVENLSTTDKSDSAVSDPVFAAEANVRSQITTIARGPSDRYCVCGKDDGSVTIHDGREGTKLRNVYRHPNNAAVIALTWSWTGKYMASADDNGRILAKKLVKKEEPGKWAVFPCLDFRDEESVRQIVFHRGERLMLLAFSTSDRVWNLKTKTEVWRQDREQGLGHQLWINHPAQNNVLLCMRPERTTAHNWLPLEDEPSEPSKGTLSRASTGLSSGEHSPSSPTAAPNTSTPRVRRVSLNENCKCIVVEVLPGISAHTKLGNKTLRLEVMEPGSLQETATGARSSAKRTLLKSISSFVRRFLGSYEDHIVFLNHEYWVCTWLIGATSAAAVKRHFFLPRDCVSPSSLPLVILGEEGSILFPRNGELAIVQNGLRL